MDANGLAAVIVALTGALATIGALVQNRRGRAEQARQQTAADQALSDKTRLDETQQALDATERRAERAEAGEERKQLRIEQLESDLDAERDRRRRELQAQEVRCRSTHERLVDTITTLQTVVVDEISRAAAGEAVAMVRPHPHEALPDLPDLD